MTTCKRSECNNTLRAPSLHTESLMRVNWTLALRGVLPELTGSRVDNVLVRDALDRARDGATEVQPSKLQIVSNLVVLNEKQYTLAVNVSRLTTGNTGESKLLRGSCGLLGKQLKLAHVHRASEGPQSCLPHVSRAHRCTHRHSASREARYL